MPLDFLTIYNSLNFLTESIRLQYSNFIFRHQNRFNEYLSFDDVINRLRMEEPIEYVFCLAEFCGNEFYVDKRCLIPRPETEEIVSKVTEYIKDKEEKFTIIDIGTGSGCIILSIAKEIEKPKFKDQKPQFLGIDISQNALEVAMINREAFGFKNKVELIESDFRDFDFSKYENLIVCSNLPYIPNNESLQKSVIDYEPPLALFGGEKGDELNNELLEILKPLKNVRAIFMEGYNGEIAEYE